MAVAVLRRARLYSGTLGTSANTAIYTAGSAPADGSAKVTFRFTICNKTASAATATLGLGTTSTPTAFILNGYSVAANDTLVMDVSFDLMGTEVLSAWAGTGSALDINVTGVVASDT